ncbi:hypothetical protein C9374_013778 [Naegleria lovaniensis]|uniref:Uncharacterized protein n=1 Tax=Naegleria lovaniensis TaxID=51637 RepID=A0AA88GEH5_NAELO|nr:uncharacterized protein C9374_013778 [Naegleria lovaniensis]KAG2370867.1 hypothetical protein C9374_013778 [Naegleria lovaniensis]
MQPKKMFKSTSADASKNIWQEIITPSISQSSSAPNCVVENLIANDPKEPEDKDLHVVPIPLTQFTLSPQHSEDCIFKGKLAPGVYKLCLERLINGDEEGSNLELMVDAGDAAPSSLHIVQMSKRQATWLSSEVQLFNMNGDVQRDDFIRVVVKVKATTLVTSCTFKFKLFVKKVKLFEESDIQLSFNDKKKIQIPNVSPGIYEVIISPAALTTRVAPLHVKVCAFIKNAKRKSFFHNQVAKGVVQTDGWISDRFIVYNNVEQQEGNSATIDVKLVSPEPKRSSVAGSPGAKKGSSPNLLNSAPMVYSITVFRISTATPSTASISQTELHSLCGHLLTRIYYSQYMKRNVRELDCVIKQCEYYCNVLQPRCSEEQLFYFQRIKEIAIMRKQYVREEIESERSVGITLANSSFQQELEEKKQFNAHIYNALHSFSQLSTQPIHTLLHDQVLEQPYELIVVEEKFHAGKKCGPLSNLLKLLYETIKKVREGIENQQHVDVSKNALLIQKMRWQKIVDSDDEENWNSRLDPNQDEMFFLQEQTESILKASEDVNSDNKQDNARDGEHVESKRSINLGLNALMGIALFTHNDIVLAPQEPNYLFEKVSSEHFQTIYKLAQFLIVQGLKHVKKSEIIQQALSNAIITHQIDRLNSITQEFNKYISEDEIKRVDQIIDAIRSENVKGFGFLLNQQELTAWNASMMSFQLTQFNYDHLVRSAKHEGSHIFEIQVDTNGFDTMRSFFQNYNDDNSAECSAGVISFMGDTHSGKSMLIKEVIYSESKLGKNNPVPKEADESSSSHSPTSANVTGFACKNRTNLETMLLLDMEGSNGGEKLPEEEANQPKFNNVEELEEFMKRRRLSAKEHLSRLAYTCSDVFVYVAALDIANNAAKQHLLECVAEEAPKGVRDILEPSLCLVFNKCRQVYDSVEDSTRIFFENHDPQRTLLKFYKKVTVVTIPDKYASPTYFEKSQTKGIRMSGEKLFKKQVVTFTSTILDMLFEQKQRKKEHGALLKFNSFSAFFGCCVDRLNHIEPFMLSSLITQVLIDSQDSELYTIHKFFSKIYLFSPLNRENFVTAVKKALTLLPLVFFRDLYSKNLVSTIGFENVMKRRDEYLNKLIDQAKRFLQMVDKSKPCDYVFGVHGNKHCCKTKNTHGDCHVCEKSEPMTVKGLFEFKELNERELVAIVESNFTTLMHFYDTQKPTSSEFEKIIYRCQHFVVFTTVSWLNEKKYCNEQLCWSTKVECPICLQFPIGGMKELSCQHHNCQSCFKLQQLTTKFDNENILFSEETQVKLSCIGCTLNRQ